MILQIALDTPLRRVFDYLPPANRPDDAPPPGVRVRVPFGRRRLIGILVGIASESMFPPSKLKAALEILDERTRFRSGHLRFAALGGRVLPPPARAKFSPPRCPPPCAPASLRCNDGVVVGQRAGATRTVRLPAPARPATARPAGLARGTGRATADEVGEHFKPAPWRAVKARRWVALQRALRRNRR